MTSLPNIQQLIDENRFDEAVVAIDLYLHENTRDDEAYFVRGKLSWRLQNYSAAVTDFETAVSSIQTAVRVMRSNSPATCSIITIPISSIRSTGLHGRNFFIIFAAR